MDHKRTRIVDIAEELGLSTATVSNVIHGKTKKISDETVKRVQELLEKREYIPSMAGILLAQNDSHIIAVIVNNHEKYESQVLADTFVSCSLSYLSEEIEQAGYFMMVKVTTKLQEIVRYASMWNMEGLVLIGYCEQDYKKLRSMMHIPFVVYDGFFENPERICNLKIDDYDGGRQMGEHLKELGHKQALCIADNMECMDYERYQGFCSAFGEENVTFLQVPFSRKERSSFYASRLQLLKMHTAAFCVSDYYAIELMQFLQEHKIRIPMDMSVGGFDDCPMCDMVYPALTSIRQDGRQRAKLAVKLLQELKLGQEKGHTVLLPVTLVIRRSTASACKNI